MSKYANMMNNRRPPWLTFAWCALLFLGFCPLLAQEPLAGGATNANYRIRPNVIHEFAVPVSPSAKLSVAASKNPPAELVKAAVAVPYGFDPEIPSPILIVTATSDGDASSIRHMRAYTNAALRLGYIVLAADGPFGKPPNDNPPWRWAMNASLLEHVHKAWPGSEKWPVAIAGFSGGGKWAGVLGAILANRNYRLIGVFMGGVNQDTASEAARIYHPASRYKETPVFISSGSEDKLATPEQHIEVKENMLSHGFSKVRLESYKGGHELNESELRTALRWFLETYSRPPDTGDDPFAKEGQGTLPPAE